MGRYDHPLSDREGYEDPFTAPSFTETAEKLRARDRCRTEIYNTGAGMYRGFKVELEKHSHWPPPWSFTHEDYDGPGDPRYGHAIDPEEAFALIDDLLEE